MKLCYLGSVIRLPIVLCAELVARKSHLSPCVEIDKVTLYNYIYPTLEGGPLESA